MSDQTNPSNTSNTSGERNISIQGPKDSTITINAGNNPTSNNQSYLPKELTLNIPKTNPDDIIGREKDLQELYELSFEGKGVVVVNGLGGIGKTTLAQAYVCKYDHEYRHIAWITQTADNIFSDFLDTEGFLGSLGIESLNKEPESLFGEIMYRMRSIEEKPNLLVIDNAGGSLYELRHKLPSLPKWHLLVTSREEIEGFQLKPLEFLNEQQAVELFNKHYGLKKLSEEEIEELVQVVDFHTLTIEILAKTARIQRYNAATLKKAIEKDLRANIRVERQEDKVEKVGSYLTSVFNLSKLNVTEVWLMKQFVCLPTEFHTYELLFELLVDEKHKYNEVFAETLSVLAQKGWLLYNKEADSFKMHRIIGEIIKQQYQVTVEETINLIVNIKNRIWIDQSEANPGEKFSWLPFGRVILNNLYIDKSKEILNLKYNYSIMLATLGEYKEAKELMEEVAVGTEEKYGVQHSATATAYTSFSNMLRNYDEYKGAKTYAQKAVALYETIYGIEDTRTAVSYLNSAGVFEKLKEYEKAKELIEKSLSIAEKHFGLDNPRTAIRYANLALVLQSLHQYEDSKIQFLKAIAVHERHFGEYHFETAAMYSNLATLYVDLGEYENAKTYAQKAVASDEKNFGIEHPTTAMKYINLAIVFERMNSNLEALALTNRALKIFEKTFPENHSSFTKARLLIEQINRKLIKNEAGT